MMTCDLQDGFYGIEVRGEDRKYLGLRHPLTGKYYRYTRLAMGAACSPSAFSRLVAWAAREARKYEEFKVIEVVVNDAQGYWVLVFQAKKARFAIRVLCCCCCCLLGSSRGDQARSIGWWRLNFDRCPRTSSSETPNAVLAMFQDSHKFYPDVFFVENSRKSLLC